MNSNNEWVPLTKEEDEDTVQERIEIEGGYRMVDRWRKNGEITADIYYDSDGNLHREDGPAESVRWHTGILNTVEYYQRGKAHRLDDPAIQHWGPKGRLQYESWRVNGVKHRPDNKPAETTMDTSGKFATEEKYYVDGRLHRTDGPAVIRRRRHQDQHRDIDTIIEEEEFYYHGHQQTGPVADDPHLTPG